MLIIPIPRQDGEAALTWTTALDGLSYRFSLVWEERTAGWFLNIALASPSKPLVNGMRLNTFVGLWEKYRPRVVDLPLGTLRVYSYDPANLSSPGFDDLGPGGRCFLAYLDQGEAPAGAGLGIKLRIKKVSP